MAQKPEHLHIRASQAQKVTLARAAEAKKMSVSQFVLQTSLPAAEEIISHEAGNVQTLFRLSPQDWKKFNRLLDAPARDIPQLRKLLKSKEPWKRDRFGK